MTDIEKLKAFKDFLNPYTNVTPWEEIKVGDKFHIPPIPPLERRDVEVTKKTETSMECIRTDDGKKTSINMECTSVYAKVLVVKKKF